MNIRHIATARFTVVAVAATAVLGASLTAVPANAAVSRTAARASAVADFERNAVTQVPTEVTGTALAEQLRSEALSDPTVSDGAIIDDARTSVLKVGAGYVVRSGLGGDGVDRLSSRSVVFDADGAKTGTVEYLFRADGAGGGSLDVFQDGEHRYGQSISASDADRTVHAAQNELRGANDFWQRLNSCLANQGVASWAVALIAGACAAVCFFTAGLGCAACIGAVIGFPSGVIGSCVVHANS
jgi:hypothetical protein